MIKGVIALSLLLLATTVNAEEVYTCTVNGHKVFQAYPCDRPAPRDDRGSRNSYDDRSRSDSDQRYSNSRDRRDERSSYREENRRDERSSYREEPRRDQRSDYRQESRREEPRREESRRDTRSSQNSSNQRPRRMSAREAEFAEAQSIFSNVERDSENCGRAVISLNGFNRDELCLRFLGQLGDGSSFSAAGKFLEEQMKDLDFYRDHTSEIERMWQQQGRISHNLYLVKLYGNFDDMLELRVPGRLYELGRLSSGKY